MIKAKFYLLILLFSLFTKVTVSQFSRPYIENFTQEEYGDTCSSLNWAITQDNRGILYFGNNLRLLEYDGENWDAIRTSIFGGVASSLYTDKEGSVFVGLNGEFGKIITDSIGKKAYISLSLDLNDDDAFFSKIWRIYKYKNSILFFSEEKIFLLSDNKISVINPETSFHLAFVVGGELYVRQREIGLMKYENNKFNIVNDGELFKDYGVFGIFQTNEEQKLLIITQELGAYNFFTNRNDSAIIPINNSSKNQLINSNIYDGVLLSDNKIGLSTSQNGVIIINQDAEIDAVINKNTGIKDNDVKQIFQDSNNDLWFTMNTGICRVNYSSQVSNFNSSSNLSGDVKTITFFNNKLIIGTKDGLFEYNKNEQKFIKNEMFVRQIYQATTISDKLIVSSELGLFEIKNQNKYQRISDITKAKFYFLESRNLLFVAGKNRIEIYKYQNKNWNLKGNISNIFINDITKIEYNQELNDSSDFWIGTINTELWNVKVSSDNKLSYIVYNYSDGLSSGFINPLKTNNEIIFGTSVGLLKFVSGKTLSEADSANNYEYKGFFEASNFLGFETDAINILENSESKIWMCKNGEIAFYDNVENKLETINFTGIDLGTINVFYPYKSNIFIGGNEGITYVDVSKPKDFNNKIKINIRRITLTDSTVLYSGKKKVYYQRQVLDNNNNSITFNFAALYNENGTSAKYSYFIEGYDDNWSDWSSEHIVKYKKLPFGDYTFKVKAKSLYDIESNIEEYKFSITPPYYLTTWAYIFYVILLLILLWVIIKLYTRKLENDKIHLEGIIEERTVEIREKKDKIETQHHQILKILTELTDSINYAQRIQQAVLPSDNYLDEILNDYFILFKPKDVVSGDFYWATKINEYVIITAADCTGHGVPGAFMSMLGTSFLNEIVRNAELTKASEILFELRKYVITALNQTGEEGEQKDGMDMSLCVINTKNHEVQYSGANNPLYIVKDKEFKDKNEAIKLCDNSKLKTQKPKLFYEVKPNKMPISIYLKMGEFDNNIIKLEKGDKIYMFSDGYADQFGGPKGKKFMYKPFKKLLLENSDKPMSEQKEILLKSFEGWRGDVDQIDDVVVLGIQI